MGSGKLNLVHVISYGKINLVRVISYGKLNLVHVISYKLNLLHVISYDKLNLLFPFYKSVFLFTGVKIPTNTIYLLL